MTAHPSSCHLDRAAALAGIGARRIRQSGGRRSRRTLHPSLAGSQTVSLQQTRVLREECACRSAGARASPSGYEHDSAEPLAKGLMLLLAPGMRDRPRARRAASNVGLPRLALGRTNAHRPDGLTSHRRRSRLAQSAPRAGFRVEPWREIWTFAGPTFSESDGPERSAGTRTTRAMAGSLPMTVKFASSTSPGIEMDGYRSLEEGQRASFVWRGGI